MKKENADKSLDIELSNMVFDNLQNVKLYLKLDSYDVTAIVLRIASASNGEGGISEAQLARELGISRATMNRTLNRLIDTKHIQVLPEATPRRYVYNFDFIASTYGGEWVEKKDALRKSIIDRCVTALLYIFWAWRDSHFEKRD